MSRSALLLYPSNPYAPAPPEGVLKEACRSLRLVGELEELSSTGRAFGLPPRHLSGPRFAELVVFEQSHPVVLLEPDGKGGLREAGIVDSRSTCRIQVVSSKRLAFHVSPNTPNPECPGCRRGVEDWGAELQTWFDAQDTPPLWRCVGCARSAPPWEYDWHCLNAFARAYVEVDGIHYEEARPSEELMRALGRLGGGDWAYCYNEG